MARSRNIKPGLFKNELLVEQPLFVRLLFVGLWTLADREGRLEDRPKRIKLELFPYDQDDTDAALQVLADLGFVDRYEADGKKVIQIVNFLKHQTPHGTERDSELPGKDGEYTVHVRNKAGYVTGTKRNNNVKSPENNVRLPESNGETPVSERPDSLIHRFTDSLNKDLKPVAQQAAPPPKKSDKQETELQAVCRKAWAAYSTAYERKYGAAPVRNAKVSAQVKGFVERVGRDEAIAMAEWFVSHPGDFYIKNLHTFGLLLADAEKLRTQWATGRIAEQPLAAKTQFQINQEATARALFGGLRTPAEPRLISGEVVE